MMISDLQFQKCTSCTTNKLDNPGSVDHFKRCQTDTFSGSILGECREKLFETSSNVFKILLKTKGLGKDSWMMEWIKIYLSDGTIWICKNSNNKWLGNNNYYPASSNIEYSVNCEG